MAIEEKLKSDGESALSLIKRFTRRVQETGVLRRAKSLRFHKRAESDVKKKTEALKRAKKQKREVYLRKMGKIK